MKPSSILAELESLGTEQNRKVYRRHGIPEPMSGVSFGNLRKLAKRIRIDHQLARQLWGSGNHDARVLATMIADPAQMSLSELDGWAAGLDNYVLADSFSALVFRTRHARACFERWSFDDGEWIGRAAWNLLSHLAMKDGSLPEEYFEVQLQRIEEQIHQGKNRVRHAMNGALIAIGLRSPVLEKLAIEAAERIGPVEVDHGDTGCKTPDAISYIKKATGRSAAAAR